MIRPERLRPGDRVAVVAPAGPVPRDTFAAGHAILGARYHLVHSERIFERTGFLAGDDPARLAELQTALDDPSIKALICARGGYGLMRIVAHLRPPATPKLIIGFSDVTVLHAWSAHNDTISVHGPVVTQLGTLNMLDVESLFSLLESPAVPAPLDDLRTLVPGSAEGPLIGGNLELVTSLQGTPFAPPLDGAILLIEEIGERPYRIDRALTQLALSGALKKIAGVVIGDLVSCSEKDGAGPSAEEVVIERLSSLKVPILADVPSGHGTRNRALPHGARVRIQDQSLVFLEGAVA
jgi:muramoyltetrapeptide carboxypeptidase